MSTTISPRCGTNKLKAPEARIQFNDNTFILQLVQELCYASQKALPVNERHEGSTRVTLAGIYATLVGNAGTYHRFKVGYIGAIFTATIPCNNLHACLREDFNLSTRKYNCNFSCSLHTSWRILGWFPPDLSVPHPEIIPCREEFHYPRSNVIRVAFAEHWY